MAWSSNMNTREEFTVYESPVRFRENRIAQVPFIAATDGLGNMSTIS